MHKTYLSVVVEVKLNLYELYFFKYAVIRSFRLALSEDMYLTVPKTGRSGQGRSYRPRTQAKLAYDTGSRPSSEYRFISVSIQASAVGGSGAHSRIFFPHSILK